MIKELHTNICIIGAGPAGASTSIFLCKEKINHIIIDAEEFPRDKICGDGLDLKAINILNKIDDNIIKNEIQKNNRIMCASWGFRILTTTHKKIDFNYKPNQSETYSPPYCTCKRVDFDNLLIQKFNTIYTQFLQNTKAINIEKIEDKWVITTQQKNNEKLNIICNLLVGADGERSIVLKKIGERKINRNHYSGGLRQYWQGIEGLHPNNLLEIYYPQKYPMSYFWIFPLQNGLANVGYGMLSSLAANKNLNIKEIFLDLIHNDPILKDKFKNATALETIKGWGLPFASLRRKCFGNGWLLVGDAGSMISPTTGEGVGTGMTTGYIAAQFIKRAIELNKFDESVFKNYDREIYRRTKDDIRLFNLCLLISPKLIGWIMNHCIHFKFFEKMFQKKVAKWVFNAYHKPLDVKID